MCSGNAAIGEKYPQCYKSYNNAAPLAILPNNLNVIEINGVHHS